jgi:hypothetical protein
MGPLADLQFSPIARKIPGAQAGAQRIAAA